ncbi:hypothetical protein SAMD00019534_043720 [Acytostelium subglobosum LB1]|uniref:hypothetical protein n=1 Tax=Acytostelium subglobosum LB1 TaxID=1410327 RepID=UPI000644C53E|nr:hypothetical protein SAMD00019534_043720 [Acytostelium subglobosum LB1]GAM21197.1 hypothetical protein SAMD00019534_043720 [Acytostelium subglobosum LB1]|eukprot:XP_012756331.1 hypothetical protein SAMD00019534_043720 [Acytostelium subglobosum LB1]
MVSGVKRKHGVQLLGMIVLMFVFFGLMFYMFGGGDSFKLIHVEGNIHVFDNGNGIRQFKFSKNGDRQSEIKIGDVEHVPLAYIRATIASLTFLTKRPTSILLVGLGGGSIATYLHKHFPSAHIDIVEMHQRMLDVAEQYSNFRRNDNVVVHISDGLDYVERQSRAGKHYDLIYQDGCSSAPCNLMTVDGFKIMSKLLSPEGVYLQNLIGLRRHFGVIRNMQEAFRELYYVESGSVNQVFIGYNYNVSLSTSDLVTRGEMFQLQEKPYFNVVNEFSTHFKRLTNVMINVDNYIYQE